MNRANTGGVRSLYIGKGAGWNNHFEPDCINWEADPRALTFAHGSPLKIRGRRVIIVDCEYELAGFYFMPDSQPNGSVKLELHFSPRFRGRLLSAPGRKPGNTMGIELSCDDFSKYLKNLKAFLE
ncbi:MAG: hypothetical protein IT288_09225 [Bdellovibrionales bacterium]|nr:hypothetical protein [Bdellovibrionales bacterium]